MVILEEVELNAYKPRGHFSRALSRLYRKKIAVFSLVVIIVIYSLGIFSPVISRYSYSEPDYQAIRQPPSWEHWAGTDRAGRDLFTRVHWAVQNTVILTMIGMLSGGLLLGVTLGLAAGYYGKVVDALIMRSGEVLSVVPTFFLVLMIAATLRGRIRDGMIWLEDNTFLSGLISAGVADYLVISFALVVFGWFSTARLVRGQVLFLRESPYVEAARALGASTPRILFRHILPNAISPLIVSVTMSMGTMVGVEIFLSWVGVGIQPPRPSLGIMLYEAGHVSVLRNEPWMILAPGIVSWLLIFSWSLLGDALNDVFNPRTQ